MNIGLDVDNVITKFDEMMLKNFLKEDKKRLNKGIVNKNAEYITKGMFSWPKEEVDKFQEENMEEWAKTLKPVKGCRKYINKLLKEGHNIILISHRVYPHYKEPEQTTVDWLKKNNINYSKLVLSKSTDKSQECKENNIDIMIDDRETCVEKMISNGVNCYVKVTKYNKNRLKNLNKVKNWKEFYKLIKKMR